MRKILLGLILIGLVLPAVGESTRTWRQSTYAEFSKGTLDGVALRSDGEIFLAPVLRELTDPGLEFVWAVAEDRKGTLYIAGGSPATVLRLDPSGTTSAVLETEELEVHALVLDEKSGTLFAATSPDGKIYRIPPKGEAEVLFDPETKYIWDLALAGDGGLYVATGDKGEIFRVEPDGSGSVLFQSDETHIRSLAVAADGLLYAGTEPSGLIYRITPKGEAFALYETGKREVTSLRLDAQGNLYAASIGSKQTAPGVPGVPGATTAISDATVLSPGTSISGQVAAQAIAGTRRIPFLTAGGSEIYKIAADGFPTRLWVSRRELVYSLSFDREGRLLAGSGNDGKIIAVDTPVLYTDLARVSSQQVTALHRTRNGSVLLATSNPGMLYRLGPELAETGSIESDVFDAELYTRWGRIRWLGRGDDNGRTGIKLYTRSGNTSDPTQQWSEWSGAYADSAGTEITSPPARFAQWKAVLADGEGHQPSLASVDVAYLRRNLAPTVETIIVQQPGVRVQEQPRGNQAFVNVQLELPPPPVRETDLATPTIINAQSRSNRSMAPPQGVADPAARSVLWTADDPNDDDLAFNVYYRGEDETQWKLLAEKLADPYYTWERTTLPDGVYYLKVTATDAPSNPADLALGAENVSDRFEVDNTPPSVAGLETRSNSATVIRFTATDSFSPLRGAEYSLDAGDWQMIFPTSRTTDARNHSYEIGIGDLSKGEHTLVVRVYDSFGNVALARTTFVVK